MRNQRWIDRSLFGLSAALFMAGCEDPEAFTDGAAEEAAEQLADDEIAAPAAGETSDGEAASFARERGIPVAEARLRLDRQALAPDLADAAQTELGDEFAGVWIDTAADDVIMIGVTSLRAGQAARVEALADDIGLDGGYRTVEVRHSLADLERANEFLAAGLERVNRGQASTLTAGLRTDLNVVELQVPPHAQMSAEQRDLVALARARFGELMVVGDSPGEATARTCSYPDCSPPLRAGVRITNSGSLCTGAFIARSNADGKLYQFTAGHCAWGRTDEWSAYFADKVAHVVGPVWSWQWGSGGDMAILKINNPVGWKPKPWVFVTGGPDTTSDPDYTITADNTSVIGMRICTTGAAYGRSDCGYVTKLGVTSTYGNVTVKGLGRGSFCGKGGDSGAPMYASHVAYGLQVAGFSECDSLYQGIRAAEAALHVSVVHG